MKCPQCQHEQSTTMKFCGECGASLRGATPGAGSNAALQAELESLRRSLTEALEQQTAARRSRAPGSGSRCAGSSWNCTGADLAGERGRSRFHFHLPTPGAPWRMS